MTETQGTAPFDQRLQALRTIDKWDKLGRDGVLALLQKDRAEFGSELQFWQAALLVDFIGSPTTGLDPKVIETKLRDMTRIRSRFGLMAGLDSDATACPAGKTAWDRLIEMPTCKNQAWGNGCRPANIAWALDDIAAFLLSPMAQKEATT